VSAPADDHLSVYTRLGDGSTHVVVDSMPAISVGVDTTGLATDATLSSIDAKTPALASGRVPVDGSGVTQPISAASLPLPSGAAQDRTTAGAPSAVRLSDGSGFIAIALDATVGAVRDRLPSALVGGRLDVNVGAGSIAISNFPVTQPVSGNVVASQGSAGSTAWKVDGSAVTQPVSAASLPLPSGAAQEHTSAASPHAVRLSDGAAFFKPTTPSDTQPVSGTVTANVGTTNGLALDATLTGGTMKAIARGGAKGATTAADVTSTAEGTDHNALDVQIYHGGTAKDPTAIRALTSADVVTSAQGTAAALASAWPVKVTDGTNTMPTADAAARKAFMALTDGTNVTAVKAASTAAVATDPAAVVSLSPNSPVTPPTLTKGTQGSTGFSTQDLKDAGRVSKVFQGSAITGVTTEALMSLVMLSDLAAATAATNYTVTSGKRFRIQALVVTWRDNTAAAGGVTVRVRAVSSGTATASSPVILSANVSTATAVIGAGGTVVVPVPDGLELLAGANFGISQIAESALVGFDVQLVGYEY